MTHLTNIDFGPIFEVYDAPLNSPVIIICEHASNRIPKDLDGLGLTLQQQNSHIAWDPGALGVSKAMSNKMAWPLVAATISRLVYDLNRPPDSLDAVRVRSENYDVPGNKNLSKQARNLRVQEVHLPFHKTVQDIIAARLSALKLIVTIHSFTPVYDGHVREVEMGILNGKHTDFAEAMNACVPDYFGFLVRQNEPYSAADGVTYSIDLHGEQSQIATVMLEIRNDLIAYPQQQQDWGKRLGAWLMHAIDFVKKDK